MTNLQFPPEIGAPGIDRRAASTAGIASAVFRACEGGHLAFDPHRVDRVDKEEIERCAMHLAAGHAVTHADAVRLSPRLEPHLAAGAAACVDRTARYTPPCAVPPSAMRSKQGAVLGVGELAAAFTQRSTNT